MLMGKSMEFHQNAGESRILFEIKVVPGISKKIKIINMCKMINRCPKTMPKSIWLQLSPEFLTFAFVNKITKKLRKKLDDTGLIHATNTDLL